MESKYIDLKNCHFGLLISFYLLSLCRSLLLLISSRLPCLFIWLPYLAQIWNTSYRLNKKRRLPASSCATHISISKGHWCAFPLSRGATKPNGCCRSAEYLKAEHLSQKPQWILLLVTWVSFHSVCLGLGLGKDHGSGCISFFHMVYHMWKGFIFKDARVTSPPECSHAVLHMAAGSHFFLKYKNWKLQHLKDSVCVSVCRGAVMRRSTNLSLHVSYFVYFSFMSHKPNEMLVRISLFMCLESIIHITECTLGFFKNIIGQQNIKLYLQTQSLYW